MLLQLNQQSIQQCVIVSARDKNVSNKEWAREYEKALWTIEVIKEHMNQLGCTYRQADVEMALFMMGK